MESFVYVLNQRGKTLMPCSPRKGRKLLREGKAKVISRNPFTLQLTIATGETTQEVILGVDGGYLHIGLSAITEKKELFSGSVMLRKDIVKLNSQRRSYRRSRRSRKTWYRPVRFSNKGKEEGWLAPSLQHKEKSHRSIIEKLEKILPVNEIVIEVASFDIQKIKNPEIEGVDYQEGEQKGFWNEREYVFHRDNHTCQYCQGKSKDPVLETHHLESRQTGSNRPDNLITLCKTCHKKVSQGKITLTVKPSKGYREAGFMTSIRWKLVNSLKEGGRNLKYTYGYITKKKRIEAGLEKSHINDAFVIAGGKGQSRSNPYSIIQHRRHNRSLQTNRKGSKPSVRKKKYPYQPGDRVRLERELWTVKGVFNYGEWARLKDRNGKIKNVATKKIELVKYGGGFSFEY
ncbi:MAG: HNH endonuclease [bacterium ADurb.Bin363]|nr:MAG: HNH endonuclease [bacterium ADurb.Bin363]